MTIAMNIKDVKHDQFLIGRDAFEIYSQCMYQANWDDYNAEIAELSSQPDIYIFATLYEEQYAGLIVLAKRADPSAEIIGIAVKKELQGCGIGSFMLDRASRLVRIDRITAETDEEAVGFYRKSGFSVKEFIRHFPDADVTRYLCTLEIKDQTRKQKA